ncbi:hypothetical protein LPJ62_005569 [Coemansia sp. RSA 2167]|nr:hypothetical protein LPJ62_005569 [Coemansia sp. RSA 2167]
MAFNAISLARHQHYDGLALSGVHALGSTSMHHINTPRLAATVCSREASMYFTPESVCGLARRRTMNSGPLYTSVIDDIPEDPFSGYLSDISEDTTFSNHADAPQLARTRHESQRQFLNKSITEPTNDVQGWSQSTVAYTPPALKVTRGASLKALGRRLSLSIMPNAVPGRIRANTQPLAQAPRTSYIAERSESQWSLQPKKRTSWFDSIKRRIQGVRSRRADAEAMVPITAYWGAECREPIDDDPEAGPTGLYPRLRSQPSLSPTSDASPVRARDDASFVPEIDIVQPQPQTLTPTPQRHPRKARFLLPHRHSIVSSAQYGVLD